MNTGRNYAGGVLYKGGRLPVALAVGLVSNRTKNRWLRSPGRECSSACFFGTGIDFNQ